MRKDTRYVIDGIPLDHPDWRWRLEKATLLPAAAARRVSTLEIARRDGVHARRAGWGTGSLSLSVFIPDTSVNTVSTPLEARLSEIQSILARATVAERKSAGLPHMCCNVVRTELSEPQETSRGALLSARLELQPFWRETDESGTPKTVTSPQLAIAPQMTFADWAKTTGDPQDAILRIKGPLTKITIIGATLTGVTVQHALTASQYLFIDTAGFHAWQGSKESWTPSTTPILLDYPPAGPIRLSPTNAGIEISTSGEGFGTTDITLRAGRYWL